MDVAFADAGAGDAHELRVFVERRDIAAARVTHRRAQPAYDLVHDIRHRALIRHLPFDAFRHELERVFHFGLEIAIGRAARHRADGAHAAITFVAAALIEEHFAGAFLGAREQRAHHRNIGAGRNRFRKIARIADAAIGDDRHARVARGGDRVHHRRQLRHANTGHDPRGTDGARPDADLDRIRARIDQRLRAVGGRHIAGRHLRVIAFALDARHRFEHAFGMAVRGIDHHHVAFRFDKRHRAAETVFAYAGGRGHAQAPQIVLARVGEFLRLLDILHRDQAHAAIGIVDHENLFDAVLVQEALGLFHLHAFAHGDELVLGHQLADHFAGIGGEAHVAIGEDADQLARAVRFRAFHDGNAGNAVALHQCKRIGQRGVWRDGDGVHHHAAFEFLHATDVIGLFFDGEIAVDHADAARLRHRDGEGRFGDGIHGGGNEGNAEFDGLGQAGSGVDLAGQDIGRCRHQQHIVKSECFADGQSVLPRRCLGAPSL